MRQEGKVIIFSAPSGAGKSTIIAEMIKRYPNLEFSISATSRELRGCEVNGKDYYFLSPEEFNKRAENGDFLEWEEVYKGTCYGTLRSELERIWSGGSVVLFDVDVKGGINIKNLLGENAISIFIMPPSVEELRKRLISRATDSEEAINKRVAKASTEIEDAKHFDKIVINDNLEEAIEGVDKIINEFI